MSGGIEYFYIDATSTRLFRIGEFVSAGELLGADAHGRLVRAGQGGKVIEVQYDIDTDQIILAIDPTCNPVAA